MKRSSIYALTLIALSFLTACSTGEKKQLPITAFYGKNYVTIPAGETIPTSDGEAVFDHDTIWWAEWTRQKWIEEQKK